ncbi:MAG TPA: class I SAM-dependent methyltransferase [Candidatus Acidoferrum sp.]|jgi:predicted O-methyltransferase YrrM|nr:class I SAM-dependent methyltransferase [Candidatus Acidoferrum sp.]
MLAEISAADGSGRELATSHGGAYSAVPFCRESRWALVKIRMTQIAGQLSDTERRLLTEAILQAPKKPENVIEVGTWLGGGSTLHILRALQRNGAGHLWGVEANRSIYEQMLANIRAAAPEVCDRFTPVFGFSQDVLPQWIKTQKPASTVDFVFLDGGNHPGEQIKEFHLLDRLIPAGGQLMAHDAIVRKGKWLVPYVSLLDNWESHLHSDSSEVGLFHAKKTAGAPSSASLRAARAKLFRMQCSPMEIAAGIMPSPVCGFILNLLPTRFVKFLYHGFK